MNMEFFTSLLMWISNSIYTIGLIPQIILNYKRASTTGLDALMIFCYVAGYLSFLFYVFGCNLPLPYKWLAPIQCFLCFVIVMQQFYYHSVAHRVRFICSYFCLCVIFVIVIPFAVRDPYTVGITMGGVSAFLWSIYQLPQAILMYKTRSTQGLSFSFLTFSAIGVFFEFISAMLLKLPFPTLIISLRGLLGYILFCIQFILYNR